MCFRVAPLLNTGSGAEAFAEAMAEAAGACTAVYAWGYASGPGVCTAPTCCGGSCVGTQSCFARASATLYATHLCIIEPQPPPPGKYMHFFV
mmetsp:Transcript_24136/g.56040  ORF Transcript_24136/g.56040 Transcript_24136/m.56040 type:complete len:92 (-) Transcript_24136:1453-1728(-)